MAYMRIFILFIIFAIFTPSLSFYIETHQTHNISLNNSDQYRVYYQPGYCKNTTDIYNPNETFKTKVQVQHQCLPNNTLELTLRCPIACSSPSQYINCTNLFTGINQTKIFNALVTMNSTTNQSHDVAVNYTIIVTWSQPSPDPKPNPDDGSPTWPIYVGVAAGVVVLVGVGIFIVKRIRKNKKDENYSQMS